MRTGRRAGPVQSPGPRVSYPIALACTWSLAVGCGAPPRAERSAIVISVDALNEQRVLGSVAKARIPSLHRFFLESACADGARPHFPAVTAPSHAAIWTGTWGTTHGITGSLVPPAGTRLDSLVDGFSYHQLNAEPLWIAAARQGRTVVAHHVTHAPGVPGYPGRTEVERRRLQDAARRVLEQEGMAALNGYNRRIAGATIVSSRTHRFRPRPAWVGDSGTEPILELSVPVGTDSLFLRVPPRGAVRLLVAPMRDLARAVEVPVVPEDTTSPRGRTLARHFSAPVSWRLSDSALVSVRVRAFAMSSGAQDFLIAIPEVRVVEANTAAVAASYEAGAPAWVGNVPFHLWRDGLLGDTLSDSRAEWRLLELAELVTDGFMRGTSWALKRKPHLLLDYFSLGDDIDHALLGYGSPRAMSLRDRLWELVDIRIGALMAAAQGTPGSMLLLTGDHGMRVANRTWHVNATLQRAGFLFVDADGRIQLDRTTAYSPTGYWITVNDARRPAGIVAAADRPRLLDSLERTLGAVRDEQGRLVVTRTFRAGTAEADSLGIGGDNGGDVYYDVADGIMWSGRLGGAELVARSTGGEHGYPSLGPEMRTVLCAFGPAIPPTRTSTARLIDVAPTVSEWLGIDPPRQNRGMSLVRPWGLQR